MNIHCNGNLLLFGLEEKLFAVPLSAVERVVRAVEVTAMPGAGPALLGAINVSDRAIPVINPYHYFGLPQKEIEPSDFMILMNLMQRQFALLVHHVPGVAGGPSPEEERIGLCNANQNSFRGVSASALVDGIRILDGHIVIMVQPESFLQKLDEASPAHPGAAEIFAPAQQQGEQPGQQTLHG